jgi:hypothetical protein
VIDVLKSLIQQFMPYAQEKMGFSHPPKLFLRQDEQNAVNPLGKTGFYDPENEAITLYTTGRHPKDIMRSLAHELQHHTQKCNGQFESVQNMGEEGYAQADPHMRSMEIEAYQASIVFRDWEDSTKGTIYYEHLQKGDNVSMSTKNWKNRELKSLLSEAWGFKMDLSKLNESKEETLEEYAAQGAYNKCMERCAEKKADDKENCKEKCKKNPQAPSGSPQAPGAKSGMSMDEQELYEYSAPPKPPEPPEPEEKEDLDEMGCPHDDEDPEHSGEDIMSMSGEDEEGDLEALGAKAMAAIQALVAAVGGEMSATVSTDDDEMMQSEPVAMSMGESKSKLRKMILQTIKEIQAEKTKGK